MKILRFILVLGGLALIGYGLYSAFFVETTETISWGGARMSSQVLGMIGLGILAVIAGLFMRRRR